MQELLLAPALMVLEEVKGVTAGVAASGSAETFLRRWRQYLYRMGRHNLNIPADLGERNHDLQRALGWAWVDVATSWITTVEADLVEGHNRPRLRDFSMHVHTYLIETDKAAQQYTEPFQIFLADYMDAFCAALDGRNLSDANDHDDARSRVEHRIAEAIWSELHAAYEQRRGRASEPLSDEDVQDLRAHLFARDETQRESLKYPAAIMRTFAAKLKTGSVPEATTSYFARALADIRSQLDEMRREQGGSDDEEIKQAGQRIGEHVDWVRVDLGRLRGELETVKELVESLSQRIEERCAPLTVSLNQFAITAGSGLDRLTYGNPEIPFVGRQAELAELARFLDATGSFRWWIVSGPGGTGKSRLALEACIQAVRDRGWDAGFVSPTSLRHLDANAVAQWRPESPMLLVVDYPAKQLDNVRDLLVQLANRRHQDPPVRVLLLERAPDQVLAYGLIRSDQDGRRLKQAFYAAEGGEGGGIGNQALKLARLADPSDHYRLARTGYAIAHGADNLQDHLSAEEFARRHAEIDGDRRALTALLIGYTAEEGGDDLEAVLKKALEREIDRHWDEPIKIRHPYAAYDPPIAWIKPWARRLLALATMVDGLTEDDWQNLDAATTDRLTPDARYGYPALQLVSKGLGRDADALSECEYLRPIRPEILGQVFVLQALLHPADDGGEENDAWLLDVAWFLRTGRGGRREMEEFAAQAARNFPAHAGTRLLDDRNGGVVGWYLYRLRRVLSGSADTAAALEQHIGELAPAARSDLNAAHALAVALTMAYSSELQGAGSSPDCKRALDVLAEDLGGVDDPEIWTCIARAITNFVGTFTGYHPDIAKQLVRRLCDQLCTLRSLEVSREWAKSANNFIVVRAGLDMEYCRELIDGIEAETRGWDDVRLFETLELARHNFIIVCHAYCVHREEAYTVMTDLIGQLVAIGQIERAQQHWERWKTLDWLDGLDPGEGLDLDD